MCMTILLIRWKPCTEFFRQPKIGLILLGFGIFSSMLVTGVISSHFKIQPGPVAMVISLRYISCFAWLNLILTPYLSQRSVLDHGFKGRSMVANSSQLGFQPVPSQSSFWADTYAKPWCRIGVYLIGMITGYILQIFKMRIHMSRVSRFIAYAYLTW